MVDTNKTQEHLESAKEELKSAAGSLVAETKEKAKEVLGAVTESIASAAEKVHAEIIKEEPLAK